MGTQSGQNVPTCRHLLLPARQLTISVLSTLNRSIDSFVLSRCTCTRSLDEDEVGPVLARAVAQLVHPPPLSVAVRHHGGPPARQLAVHAVTLAPVAQVLALRRRRADRAHLLACKGMEGESKRGK